MKLVDLDGEQVQRPPLRYGTFGNSQRFVVSNRQQTVYRNSYSNNVRYSRSGYREITHIQKTHEYLKSKNRDGIHFQYTNDIILTTEAASNFVIDVKNFISKVTENCQYSIISEQTNIYTELGNKTTTSMYIEFDDERLQNEFNYLQTKWNECYNYIKEKYSIGPKKYGMLSKEGWDKMSKLGKSPYRQLIDDYEENKSNYKIVEKRTSIMPTIRATDPY